MYKQPEVNDPATLPQWLDWAQRLQAIAQTGLSYQPHVYDAERYQQVMQIAAEIMAAGSDAHIDVVQALFDAQTGHATPKVDSRGVVFCDETILLVQEVADGNRWTLPGGWVDINESPSGAVEREVFEESGYRVRATKLLALYDRNRHPHAPAAFHTYKMFFQCELLDEARDITPNFETSGIGFFRLDALPELSTARVTHSQIARFFDHLKHPDWQTDFD